MKEHFAALGEMSADIAHEFKNSIATIVRYAQMSSREADVATLQSYAREIRKGSQALSHIVEDDGRGIPNHQLAKSFFPFFTTKPHGTGLGFPLVQKIVLAHNDRVEVQSTEGKGTRFTVTLPRKS